MRTMIPVLTSACVLLLATFLAGQDSSQEPQRRRLDLSLEDVSRLVAMNNSSLKAAFIEHLIQEAVVREAEAAFDAVAFGGVSGGVNESVFPAVFPTGQIGPNGEPIFFQAIVTDTTSLLNVNAGVRGLLPTGATWEFRLDTAMRNREEGGLLNPSYLTTGNLSFTQPILRNAWTQYNEAQILKAQHGEKMSRQRFKSAALGKVFEAHQAYWEFVYAIRDQQVRQASLGVAKKLLEINRVKVRTGASAPIEIVSAEAGVSLRETEVLVGANAIRDRADGLRRLILPLERLDDWDVAVVPTDDPDGFLIDLPPVAECIQDAMDQRPDLREAKLLLLDRAVDVAVADTEGMPKMDMTGSLNWLGIEGDFNRSLSQMIGENGATTWNIGVSVEFPLGNRAARARISRARLGRDQAIRSLKDLELTAIAEIRAAHRSVEIAARTISSREKTAELKAQELKNEQIKLEQRVSTNFQVLEIEKDLAESRSLVLRAAVDYRIALADLARSVGSTLSDQAWPVRMP